METKLISVEDNYPVKLPIFPLDGQPLFPGMITQILITQKPLLEIIKKAEKNNGYLGLVLLKKTNIDNPYTFSNLYKIGTLAKIHKKINLPDNDNCSIFLKVLERFRISEHIKFHHPLVTRVKYIPQDTFTNKKKNPELVALTRSLITEMKEIVSNNPMYSEDVRLNMVNIDQPGQIADFLTSILNIKREEQQEILETDNLHMRIIKVLTFLNREKEVIKLQMKIQSQISETVENHKREHFLREMLKEIKNELGEPIDGKTEEIKNFRQQLETLPIDDDTKSKIKKDIDKLELLDSHNPEHSVLTGYLEKVMDLPWQENESKKINLASTQKILDKEHYGLEKVKNRIIEHLAVKQIEQSESKSIICLIGPPGVGKTSIARSIASAMNKKLYHFSVGGMRDEAEIKGHRRTYIGAMPGKIIQGLLLVKEKNPVFVIDEIDKISNSIQGDPSSALLEVLDPIQNIYFRDLFIDLPFDLSKIFFITTANSRFSIPKPLLDRMEIIEISGYIDEEKISIAKKYIIPKSISTHGLKKQQIIFTSDSLKVIAEHYAREAGMRLFEQQVNKIIRKITTKFVKENELSNKNISKNFWPVTIDKKEIEQYLGIPPFREPIHIRASVPGTAVGLAWTSAGGEVLIIEAQAVKGEKGIKITGSLGNVMKESVQIAFTLAKNYISQVDNTFFTKVDTDFFNTNEIHLHVPEGGTPKDGPSAGITLAVALISLATQTTMKSNFAMTGELSLVKQVLPIGGLREKIVAARRNKIKNIIIPKANITDLEEIPSYITKGINIYPVSHLEDVFALLFPKMKFNCPPVKKLNHSN